MKKGIRTTMAVKLLGISLDDVTRVDFVFKQDRRESAPALKMETFTADGSIGECTRSEDAILVPWSRSETYKFKSGDSFFMDTRIEMEDCLDSPETPIVELVMCPTLFEEEKNG